MDPIASSPIAIWWGRSVSNLHVTAAHSAATTLSAFERPRSEQGTISRWRGEKRRRPTHTRSVSSAPTSMLRSIVGVVSNPGQSRGQEALISNRLDSIRQLVCRWHAHEPFRRRDGAESSCALSETRPDSHRITLCSDASPLDRPWCGSPGTIQTRQETFLHFGLPEQRRRRRHHHHDSWADKARP